MRETETPTTPFTGAATLADGTTQHAVTQVLTPQWLIMGAYQVQLSPRVVPLGGYDLILGQPWLQATNPVIDWSSGTVRISLGARITSSCMHTSQLRGLSLCSVPPPSIGRCSTANQSTLP